MKQPAMALHVRFRSKLPFEEMVRVLEARAPDFAALACLTMRSRRATAVPCGSRSL